MDREAHHDALIFRLTHPVPVTSKVQPVRLPPPDADYLYTPAFISGWGVHTRNGQRSETLKAAELTVRTRRRRKF